MLDRKAFVTVWDESFGTLPRPLLLRERFKDRWFRIHSLPEGERHAETRREHQILLLRHNRLQASLFADDKWVIIITAGDSTWPPDQPRQNSLSQHPDNWHWQSFPSEAWDPKSPQINIYARLAPWKPGNFDMLISLAAEDRIDGLIILGLHSRRLYMPYDGGADAVLGDPAEAQDFKRNFFEYLSPREDGL